MKKEIQNKQAIFPMPVLLISTFNDDGSVDVMNAAWGCMFDTDVVYLNLSANHKTVKNIKARKGLVVSLADEAHIVEADYVGIVSANDTKDKFERSKLSYEKSKLVDAPIINEFPVAMECEFVRFVENDEDCGLLAKVKRTTVNEECLKDGKVDIDALKIVAYDPFTFGYYKVQGRVANAFNCGLKLKK